MGSIDPNVVKFLMIFVDYVCRCIYLLVPVPLIVFEHCKAIHMPVFLMVSGPVTLG